MNKEQLRQKRDEISDRCFERDVSINGAIMEALKVNNVEPIKVPQYVADDLTRFDSKFSGNELSFVREMLASTRLKTDNWLKDRSLEDVCEVLKGNFEVEEPLYYAKVKGHKLISENGRYWNYGARTEEIFLSSQSETGSIKTRFTLTDWNNVGINEENADFERSGVDDNH